MNSLRITLQNLQKSICHFGLALLILAGMLALHGNTSLLHAQSTEICDNGSDDDGDTLIDCDDPDCRFPLFDGGIYGDFYRAGVALGDLDGDGDLDTWVAKIGPNLVWINQGGAQGGTPGSYADSSQALGNNGSKKVALGDIDSDGDLDAWVANTGGQPNRLWINDGNGNFTDSGQSLGNSESEDVALGDLDGDGDLDAWVANSGTSSFIPNSVWINQGGVQGGTPGIFTDSGQALGSSSSLNVALGDLDGDGDLDAWVANRFNQPNRVWINDGFGNFTAPIFLGVGNSSSYGVALGDLDGDGDLDAWVANSNQPNRVWLNDGLGIFIDSGQNLGNSQSWSVALGDLDGDGDLDAWVANGSDPNRMWINDGLGNYTFGQVLGSSNSIPAALGDLDGDGDLDVWSLNTVFINQGGAQGGTTGIFTDSGQALGYFTSHGVALGDLDGDGDLDAYVANGIAGNYNHVWINQGGMQCGINGAFTDSGQQLGYGGSTAVALGDLDGDGDLDAWIANWGYSTEPAANRVWINQGGAQGGTPSIFTDNGQSLGSLGVARSNDVALGDLDGDGDLDAWVANDQGSQLWINQGGNQGGTPGSYANSGQAFDSYTSFGVDLGDLDGDGDLDAWVANLYQPNRVWLNDGFGNYSDSGQALGNSGSRGVDLGDIDGDGDLDAWVANWDYQPNRVWLNDGNGNFTDSGQALGNSESTDVSLGDLDGDGDPDAWVVNELQPNRVWINDGFGNYTDSDQTLGGSIDHFSNDVALGDLDGDSDLDALVANSGPNRVWFNQIACFNEEATQFIRGDVNGDGGVDIGDAIATLDYLFTGGCINCDDAADSNDDGAIDVADGIQILGYLFSGTGDLPAPFPTCGTDPTPDTLECESYNGC